MSDISPQTVEQTVFLAAIGNICLQWALLEQTVIAIIGTAENISLDKTSTRYGSLDMLPRLNMAIRLTREARWPQRFITPLVSIRKALQRDGAGLAEQRNMFVHGVHQLTDVPDEFLLVMARWGPDKRKSLVTTHDAAMLVVNIAHLVQKADGVFQGYGAWKFGSEFQADRSEQIAQTKAFSRFIRAKNIKRAVKLLWTNLKP